MSDPCSVLVDACAMASLSIYCELCDSVSKEYGTAPSKLFPLLPPEIKRKSLEHEAIAHGYKCYNYLKNLKQNGDFILYFSRFSKIELFDIFLDISFDETLANNGISFRLRRKRALRWQINFDYNAKIIARYEKIETCLDGIGISITCPEADPRSSHRLAFEINDVLSSHIFLDSFDSYLYSLGLFFMVDEIFTYDTEFKDILNEFRTRPEWKKHRDALKSDIIKLDPDYQSLCTVERKKGPRIDLNKFKLPVMVPQKKSK